MLACINATEMTRKQKAMERKRDGFVLLGVVAGAVELPGGRILTHAAAAPKALHHFTRFDRGGRHKAPFPIG